MKKYVLYYILLAFLYPIASNANNYVIINQVLYDSSYDELPESQQTNEGEFVELYNAGTASVSLQGWKLRGGGTNEVYTFQNLILPSGKYLIVAYRRANSTFQMNNVYTFNNNSIDTIIYQNSISLANEGETITLSNNLNDTVDLIHYDGNDFVNSPYLLHASNPDLTQGDSCVSLHRTWVEFDADGMAVPESSLWRTDRVSFGTSLLSHTSYYEESIIGAQALPTGENYTLSIIPLDPTTRISIIDGQPSVSSGVRVRTNLQYYDGLGRPDETIDIGVTPEKDDVVSLIDYYGTTKTARQWLPVVMDTEGQKVSITNVQSQAVTDYNDSRPFFETRYENSALMRPSSQKRPGASYSEYPASQSYGLNSSSDNVRIYTVNHLNNALCTDGSYYAGATLYKTSSSDEDGHSPLTIYTDMLGRKIMEERGSSRTYYVYDDLGRLRYVLPNLPTSKLTNGSYTTNNTVIKGIAYYYSYDERGNMITKKLPGCKEQILIYDQIGQLILKQDGNQQDANKWTLFAYDSIGQNLYTAEIVLASNPIILLSYFADRWQVEHYVGSQSEAIPDVGYTCSIPGASNIRMLTVNYYDNYEYMSLLNSEEQNHLGFVQETGYGRPCDTAKGCITGTKVYNLSEAGATITAYYYDIHGRLVQSRGTRNAGGYITTSTEYLFDGSVAQQMTIQGPDTALVREHYRYSYDHAGRAKEIHYQLNNEDEITLSAFSYDSIGRLAQNLLHNKDTITYSYDMRNMLTNTRNKHFSEKLYYADDFLNNMQSVSQCHNGNIAAVTSTYGGSSNTYAYTYDSLNRLKESKYFFVRRWMMSESFGYDNAGNILSLKRYYNGAFLIDDLDYTYGTNSNHLLSVSDAGLDGDFFNVIEYHNVNVITNMSHIPNSMEYDSNGNLASDVDRDIVAIRYNYLNLPDTIQFGNGNQIVNLYDATGRKYRSIIYTVPSTAITPIHGIVHYALDVDTIDFLVTEYAGSIENKFSRTDTIQRIHNTIGYYTDGTYFHYLKDHLGNICAVVRSTTDDVVQQTQYYASGVPMQSNTLSVQPYLYNSKELVTAHELNEYEYGFRNYYTTIGRFTSMDPLAEQTPWQSPYSYAGNRFVNAIDWMGLSGLTTSTCHWIAVDENDIIIDYDLLSPDKGVYLVDDDQWDGTYWDLLRYKLIGRQYDDFSYQKGSYAKYDISGNGYFNNTWNRFVPYGIRPREHPLLIRDILNSDEILIYDILQSNFFGYNLALSTRILEKFNLNPEYIKFLHSFSNALTIAEAYNLYKRFQFQGVTVENIYDSAMLTLTTLAAKNPEVLLALLEIDIMVHGSIIIGEGFIELYNNLNMYFGSLNFWGNWYMDGF